MADMDEGDRRKRVRRRTLKKGRLIFNNGQTVIDCVVKNLSSEGARLALGGITAVPDEFEVRIMDDPSRYCRVIWRSAYEIGVAFI